MKKSSKFYIFIFLFTSIAFVGASQTSNFYENTVSSSVCEGDSNIIKAGCSVAVGQVVRVTPGIVTGVTLDKMATCYDKYGPESQTGTAVIIDLNDPCNQIAMLNPAMDKQKYAYVPFDEASVFSNSRPGIASLATIMEVAGKKATDGMLMDSSYFAANTFKNVPYLKTAFAQNPTNPINKVTELVYNIWQIMRNMAYLLLLIGALVLGIVIMLGNQNIDKDGKIKLTVERAIPRVVLAVILISSSYWLGELILNTLLSNGIVQGIAAFFITSIIGQDVQTTEPGTLLSFPLIILLMGVVQGLLAATAGSAIIPIIVSIVFAAWRFLKVNFLIIKNIISVLIYIIISPLILVKGVQPSQNNSETFKEYFAKLIYFVITGFGLNLVLYGSKAMLLLGTTILAEDITDPNSLLNSLSAGAIGSVGTISYALIWLFSIILCIYILGLADKVEDKASELAADFTGSKKTSDKKEDKK
jgi:hypothetical protein